MGKLSLGAVAQCFAIAGVVLERRGPPPKRRPALSCHSLERARTTLEDFSTFYLPLHGLPPAAFFRHLPLLVFSEAAIYQLDEENEAFVAVAAEASVHTPGNLWPGPRVFQPPLPTVRRGWPDPQWV